LRRARLLSASFVLVTMPGALAGADHQPVLNEILYDPAGADAGGEYVELFNAGLEPVNLDGLRLEFANGAEGPVWQLRWQGAPGVVLAAGAHYLITDPESRWTTEPDAEVILGLQNGPDALRLVRGEFVVDLVGYGALDTPSLYEGAPAIDVGSGVALARRPDGQDSDDNAADLVPAAPSPGGRNFALFALALEEVTYEPSSLTRPGRRVAVRISVRCRGIQGLGAASGVLLHGADSTLLSLPRLAADSLATLVTSFATWVSDRQALTLIWPVAGSADTLHLALGEYLVGASRLQLSEVMAAPAAGQSEWIELSAAAEQTVTAGDYRLRDADGSWRTLPELQLLPGERLVLVQDAARFRESWGQRWQAGGVMPCFEGTQWERVVELAGWPALNNTAPAGRSFADLVLLADAAGVVDHVIVGAGAGPGDGAAPSARSVERIAAVATGAEAANWATCVDPLGGTPGCPNSVAGSGSAGAGLLLDPNPFGRLAGAEVQHLRFRLTEPRVAYDLRIFDLWGQAVRDLGGDALGPGERDLLWDGRDDAGRPLPAGAYIVLLRYRDAAGFLLGGEKRLAVLATAAGP